MLEIYIQNAVEKLVPDSSLKNQNWVYLWFNSLQFYAVCFYCILAGYRNIMKPSCRPLPFTLNKAFLKNKKGSGTSLSPSFSAWLMTKSISVMFFQLTKFHCLAAFSSWGVEQYMYCNFLLTRLWLNFRNFEVDLIFLIKPFFLHDQKVKTKI